MRIVFLFLFSFLISATQGLIHAQAKPDSCPVLNKPGVNLFIKGYRDTIYPGGSAVRVIDASSLTGNFELLCNDTSVRIQAYDLLFDGPKGLYFKSSEGGKMLNNHKDVVPLEKINEAKIISISKITVQYRGKCYKMNTQIYHVK